MQRWRVLPGELRGDESLLRETHGCRTPGGRPVDWLEVIFPIIDVGQDPPWDPIGTGFFIGKWGLFVTAKHVVMDGDGRPLELAGVQLLLGQKAILIRRLTDVVAHDVADLAAGYLEQDRAKGRLIPNSFVEISCRARSVGDRIATYAYPLSERARPLDNGFFEFELRCGEFGGEILDYYPDGRDRVLHPAPCYRTTCNPTGGASGGPVASKDGTVFAVNSTGIDGTEEGFCSALAPILGLEVHEYGDQGTITSSKIDLKELANHGMVRFGR